MTEQSPNKPALESVQPLPVEPESVGAGSEAAAMKKSSRPQTIMAKILAISESKQSFSPKAKEGKN